MNLTRFLTILLCCSYLIFAKCELLTMATVGLLTAGASYFSYQTYKNIEFCRPPFVDPDLGKLDTLLKYQLYGQHIAYSTVLSALKGHIYSVDPPKALAMSFHGGPGTGKNYVAELIVQSFFQNGTRSKFYYHYNGRNDFPLEERVPQYKDELVKNITHALSVCENSIFVFDEVDKMPAGVLNVLVPFLDYGTYAKNPNPSYFSSSKVYKKKAIFIFLSNTGSRNITKKIIGYWEKGFVRQNLKLSHFENLVTQGAFNEKGGFYRSDTILSSVIDHYVPFLPLEEEHVRKCIKRAFAERQYNPSEEDILEVLTHVTFDPPPHNLYSKSGCKRIDSKINLIIYRSHYQNKEITR
ncbi:torsin-1A-like [Prorops nasuta]|uniref:torsin-1A-like n=1 Tax=Prorops nasuta TaxID=863751 RepID=UPI0034CE56DA